MHNICSISSGQAKRIQMVTANSNLWSAIQNYVYKNNSPSVEFFWSTLNGNYYFKWCSTLTQNAYICHRSKFCFFFFKNINWNVIFEIRIRVSPLNSFKKPNFFRIVDHLDGKFQIHKEGSIIFFESVSIYGILSCILYWDIDNVTWHIYNCIRRILR